jgi:hypothetical protein
VSGLPELAVSEAGAELLGEEGVFLDRPSFLEAISAPPTDVLHRLSEPSDRGAVRARPIVYMGQQLSVDYGASVFAKLAALGDLQANHGIRGCALWVDTDRAGSDRRMTAISWPRRDGRAGVSLAPPGSKDREPRFIRIERRELPKALDRLRTYLGEAEVAPGGLDRYAHLRAILSRSPAGTLADLSAEITDLLLAEHGITLAPVRLSRLLEEKELKGQVEACVNALPKVIEVFNRALFDLRERGIDPLLHPLADDYLPLHIACASDATRLPLRRRDEADGAYAVATCRCGTTHRFRLGREELTVDEIVQTHRWSPSVFLPTLLNDLASGVVAGKSSAIYGMVLNRVLREALDKEPIPMLVPESLTSRDADGPPRLVADSLMVSYLLGH